MLVDIAKCLKVPVGLFSSAGIFGRSSVDAILRWGDNSIALCYDGKSLVFSWRVNNDPEARRFKVDVVSIPTNLGNGQRWYFVCPTTGRRCMNLYFTESGEFVTLPSIHGAVYPQQRKSRRGRLFFRYSRYCNPPIRKYGKLTYQGRQTPYGRRLERYSRIMWDLDDEIMCLIYPLDNK